MITAALPPPRPSSAHSAASSSRGMDPSVFDMMKKMRAEKAAAQASGSANKVKIEPAGDATASSTLCGKKRSLEKANSEEEATPPSVLLNTPPATHGCSVPGGCSPPPDFSCAYALDLEDKLVARDADVAALREELEKSKAELSAAKEATEAELEKSKAELSAAKEATEAELEKVKAELSAVKETARAKRAAGTELEKTKAEFEKVKAELGAAKRAVQEFFRTAEQVRRRADHALDGYERWRGTSTARSGSTRSSPGG
ncbi:uncharacterized protein LOC100828149 [Brachypodium distachyon]|uniref:uncharacterized protein LOC100828149 n=1 Tax=Brachypodium distachyon TaxID=15368 RepID=UPI000D0D3F38|nr:uncharacterized protein LOC100828149 [Brachypodium distachyon]|eukprot:XP_014752738.2 uncharacterized protein LOC100828149 [Brachypodium distachyon]